MKLYLTQNEMMEGTWLLVKAISEGVKSKKKFTKEEFKKEFIKSDVYSKERKKLGAWLDTFLLDSTRYDWKKMRIVSVRYRSPYDEVLGKKGKLSHEDSLRLKTLPDLRLLSVSIEDSVQAWELNILQVKWNQQWKFMERPRLNYGMKSSLLDTMFRAALNAHFIEKKIENPYVLVDIEDSLSHERTEIVLCMEELEKYVVYLRKMKEIKTDEVFKVYSRHLLLDTRTYAHLKERFGLELEDGRYRFKPWHKGKNSKELMSSVNSRDCDPLTAAWYFRRGILVSCEPPGALLIVNVDLGK